METTINWRINQVMEAERMNINTFSKSLGKSYTAVEGVVKSKSKPGYDFLESLFLQYPHINPTWLLTGEGEMLKQTVKEPVSTDSYLVEHMKTLEENFARLAAQLEAKDKQLEAAGRTVEGLQRTVDALIARPVAQTGNFKKPATSTGRSYPSTLQKKNMHITA